MLPLLRSGAAIDFLLPMKREDILYISDQTTVSRDQITPDTTTAFTFPGKSVQRSVVQSNLKNMLLLYKCDYTHL